MGKPEEQASKYPIILYPEDDGYTAVVPDLQGCVSVGDTPDEAVANALEAATLCLEVLMDEGRTPQPPGTFETPWILVYHLNAGYYIPVGVYFEAQLARTYMNMLNRRVGQYVRRLLQASGADNLYAQEAQEYIRRLRNGEEPDGYARLAKEFVGTRFDRFAQTLFPDLCGRFAVLSYAPEVGYYLEDPASLEK